MRVLGISPFHDSSVTLYTDGQVEFFMKEERLSREKRDKHPFKALNKALEISPYVDVVVYCPPSNREFGGNSTYVNYIKKHIKPKKILNLEDHHHLQHASISFYNSGFKKALVIVADRNGSYIGPYARESESVFVAEYPANITPIYKNFWLEEQTKREYALKDIQNYYQNYSKLTINLNSMQGLVKVYESATTLIGEHVLENGKTMGLSAYGSEDSSFPNLFIEYGVGNNKYFYHKEDRFLFNSCHSKLKKNLLPNNFTKNNFQEYADYAYQVQIQTQTALGNLIESSIHATGIENVCLSGGYALNVVANAYFIKRFPGINFYFEPIADDSGTSIGGAMYGYRLETEDSEVYPLKNTFFNGTKEEPHLNSGVRATAKDIAQELLKGKSVAIFYGKAEAGPRALGNRSILFDARHSEAKTLINKVKNREWYRPFAASVLEEDAGKYFDMIVPISPFMTISFDALPGIRNVIPGVIHIDNTCRIQTVPSDGSPLRQLLEEFKALTGHGVLLNTSFNLAGEPLVQTLDEATSVLDRSLLDILWIPEAEKMLNKI